MRGLQREDGKKNLLGRRLAEARRRQEPAWTQERLSEELEAGQGVLVAPGTIGKIEAGIRGVYDYEVAAFATALGVSANWLLGLDEGGSARGERE